MHKMTLKNFIKNILPFGIVIYLKKKQFNDKSLESLFLDFKKDEVKFAQSTKSSNFKYIVSVQGFGYSGSGAIIDLLREFTCSTVYGGVDKGDSGAKLNKQDIFEVDFFRLSGGFFEIDKLINSKNIFINDAAIKRFILLINNMWFRFSKTSGNDSFCDSHFMNAILDFLDNIIDFSINDLSSEYYNIHIENPYGISINNHKNIYFLKSITREEYRKYVRMLVTKLFSTLPDNHLLVLDQFFADNEDDIARNLDYIPTLKTIFVQRDPRDVYVFAKKNGIEWIPTNNVDVYIKWYSKMLETFPVNHPTVLNLRFEDLILNYDKTICEIYDFLELSPKDHVLKKQILNPDHSKRNVGIWKTSMENLEEIKIIENSLSQWCFNF